MEQGEKKRSMTVHDFTMSNDSFLSTPKKHSSHRGDDRRRVSQMIVSLNDWLKSVGFDQKVTKEYVTVLNEKLYKTLPDLLEAPVTKQDMIRYGIRDDKNVILFEKALNDALLDYSNKKPKDDERYHHITDTLVHKSSRKTDIIKLNVGGTKFETYRSTLLAIPDTYFTNMLETNQSEYFIDRDGAKFSAVLNLLRDFNVNHYLLNAVDPVEAVFYKLPIQPLFQTLENEKQQTRALVNVATEGLGEEISQFILQRPVNHQYVQIVIVSHVEWLNFIHHKLPLDPIYKQIIFENVHPKVNCFFWSELKAAFKEKNIYIELQMDQQVQTCSYSMKVYYFQPTTPTFDSRGMLLVHDPCNAHALQQPQHSTTNLVNLDGTR